jgi:hypothetical protein
MEQTWPAGQVAAQSALVQWSSTQPSLLAQAMSPQTTGLHRPPAHRSPAGQLVQSWHCRSIQA